MPESPNAPGVLAEVRLQIEACGKSPVITMTIAEEACEVRELHPSSGRPTFHVRVQSAGLDRVQRRFLDDGATILSAHDEGDGRVSFVVRPRADP